LSHPAAPDLRAPSTPDRSAGREPGIRNSLVWRIAVRIGHLPIYHKVLIANSSVVVLGAVAGTWITIQTVRRAPEDRFVPLAAAFVAAGIVLSVAGNWLALRVAFRPLDELQRVGNRVRTGDLSARARIAMMADPELASLATALNLTLDELAEDRAQLRSLTSQVIRAQEDERRRVARELHDETAQMLFAQLLRITALRSSADPLVREAAEQLEHVTVEALEGVRRLALELRPPALDDLGLEAALGELAQRHAELLRVPIAYRFRGSRDRVPPDVELVLYRVAQEALTNASKHARATRVEVEVDRRSELIRLTVRDDGRGFDVERFRDTRGAGVGLGLFGMEERLALVGGDLRIVSEPGAGSELQASIPLRPRTNVEAG
jgi:two-component system sensor histidine kinase UhpB